MDANDEWLKKTGAEREALLVAAYGPVSARAPLGVAGAEVLTFPPVPAKRAHWIYVTHGIAQPKRPEDVGPRATDPEDPSPSGHGYELAFLTREAASWAVAGLQTLARYLSNQQVGVGVRAHFTFTRPNDPGANPDQLVPVAGMVQQNATKVSDHVVAVLWPALDRDGPFVCSTGRFDLLVATPITPEELALAEATSSGHVLYLLKLAGQGQKTDPFRKSLPPQPRFAKEVKKVTGLTRDQVLDALYGPA